MEELNEYAEKKNSKIGSFTENFEKIFEDLRSTRENYKTEAEIPTSGSDDIED